MNCTNLCTESRNLSTPDSAQARHIAGIWTDQAHAADHPGADRSAGETKSDAIVLIGTAQHQNLLTTESMKRLCSRGVGDSLVEFVQINPHIDVQTMLILLRVPDHVCPSKLLEAFANLSEMSQLRFISGAPVSSKGGANRCQ